MSVDRAPVRLRDIVAPPVAGFWGEEKRSLAAPVVAHVIRNGDIPEDRRVRLEDLPLRWFSRREIAKAEVSQNDSFVVSSGYIGKSGRLPSSRRDHPVVASNFVRVLKALPGIDPGWLYHLLDSHSVRLAMHRNAGGSTIVNLSSGYLDEVLDVPGLPSLPAQVRIAKILDTIDDAIRGTEQVIAKLRQTKQGLLQDLLTLGIDERGELRDAERRPEQFVDSPLGPLPREWSVTPLGELVTLQGGFAFSSTVFGRGPIPVIRMSNLRGGALHTTDAARVATSFLRTHSDFALRSGDLLIGMSGSLDNTAIVEETHLPLLLNQRVGRFVLLNPDRLRYRLLDLYLASSFYARQVWQEAVGAAQLNISSRQVEATIVPLPPLREQDAILDRWTALAVRFRAESDSLLKLRTLRLGLMDDLLTGRVPVPVPDQVAT